MMRSDQGDVSRKPVSYFHLVSISVILDLTKSVAAQILDFSALTLSAFVYKPYVSGTVLSLGLHAAVC